MLRKMCIRDRTGRGEGSGYRNRRRKGRGPFDQEGRGRPEAAGGRAASDFAGRAFELEECEMIEQELSLIHI